MNTKSKTNTRTEQILKVMHIVAWVAFIGFMIEAGAILFSYGVSLFKPEASRNLYEGLNLYTLKQFGFWRYTMFVSFVFALLCVKAYISYLVIKVSSAINLMNPFKIEIARIVEKISYTFLTAAIIAFVGNMHSNWMSKSADLTLEKFTTEEFMFMAGLVFIISQVFKRGVELQTENDLTV